MRELRTEVKQGKAGRYRWSLVDAGTDTTAILPPVSDAHDTDAGARGAAKAAEQDVVAKVVKERPSYVVQALIQSGFEWKDESAKVRAWLLVAVGVLGFLVGWVACGVKLLGWPW